MGGSRTGTGVAVILIIAPDESVDGIVADVCAGHTVLVVRCLADAEQLIAAGVTFDGIVAIDDPDGEERLRALAARLRLS